MFYVAKVLQAIGMADVAYALFVAITQNTSMAEEIVITLIGVAVFYMGWALEQRVV
ncbi:MAG: hypothetical protein ACE5JU_10550 [Candidatus Binatia bacterium]